LTLKSKIRGGQLFLLEGYKGLIWSDCLPEGNVKNV
jgi:hypothetical protein